MDSVLWGYGEQVAQRRLHLNHPWELDVLRGMHQQRALDALALYLGVQTGEPIRLTSIWMDKQVWASWIDANGTPQSRKELADLAVVVRRRHGRGIHRWMWIAQAKSLAAKLAPYTGISSANEIDLLHRMPSFKLANVTKDFDLQKDFSNPAISGPPWNRAALVPWTFLDFDKVPSSPASASQQGVTPIAARWPASSPTSTSWAAQTMTTSGLAAVGLASYSECLVAIIKGNMSVDWHQAPGVSCQMIPGAPIDAQYPEWTRLYYHLLSHNRAAKNGHASVVRGQKEDVIRISKMLADFSYAHHFHRDDYPPHDLYDHKRPYRFDKRRLARLLGKPSADLAWSLSNQDTSDHALARFDILCAESEPDAPGDEPPKNAPDNYDGEPEGQMQFLLVDVIGSE